jgi:serine/threonine-protein kinase mTOR
VAHAHSVEKVSNTISDMVFDATTKQWEDDINRRLSDLMHSQANYEKMGGIIAIGERICIYKF